MLKQRYHSIVLVMILSLRWETIGSIVTQEGRFIHHAMNAEGFEQHDDALTIKGQIPLEVWDNYFKFSMTRNPWDRALFIIFLEEKTTP